MAQERGNLHLHFEVVLFLIREDILYVFEDKVEVEYKLFPPYMLLVLCFAKVIFPDKMDEKTTKVGVSQVNLHSTFHATGSILSCLKLM